MFKRPRVRATSRLVNASSALALLFLASACGQSGESPQTPVESEASEPSTAPDSSAISLPAVWSTSPLDGPVSSLGIAGELGSTFAIGYSDGSLQLFDFEGDRITEAADLGVEELADGRYLLLSGTPVTLFPGIDQDGALQAYIHGGSLDEPLPLDLKTTEFGKAAGLCSGPPSVESDGVLRLAFWTAEQPTRLMSGRLVEVGDDLVYLLDDPVMADRPITACVMEDVGVTVFSAPVRDAVVLERNGKRHTLTMDTSGNYARLAPDGASAFAVRDGISVRVPGVPTAMSGTGDARGGGYPGGLVVVTGEVSNGDHRAVLIDPSDFTLTPLGVPAASPD